MKVFMLKEIPKNKPKAVRKRTVEGVYGDDISERSTGFSKDKAAGTCVKTCLLEVS